MLTLVEAVEQKKRLEKELRKEVKRKYQALGEHRIGYQGGQIKAHIYSNGQGSVWAAFHEPEPDERIQKYWNGFGTYEESYELQVLTVEVNVPFSSNSQRVSGYFGANPTTGHQYLMHSGKVGGGKLGVGKTTFLGWYKEPLVSVLDGDGGERQGIVIARFGSKSFISDVERFVRKVSEFKGLANRHALDFGKLKNEFKDLELYSSEYWGTKRGGMRKVDDYITYHGKVVDELFAWRKTRSVRGERVARTALKDMIVSRGKKLREVYEVKTSADRSSLYSALGQLLVHSNGDEGVAKFLVVPTGQSVPADIARAIRQLNVSSITYSLDTVGNVKILDV